MSDRKPPGVSFESWVDRQIREAKERGDFDNLSGTGEPIAGLDRPHDDLWWVRDKLKREQLSYLPPALALRKDAEDTLELAMAAPSESEVRRLVEELNDRIRAGLRTPSEPPVDLMPYGVDEVVERWRAQRPG